ncbi:Fic family protein [uncultured Oscillibacter sp.]|uniref:Fic family protein n=1 Tax=uncultured Oscillibacter sp. TaxID=876091 RepID=UPI002629A8DC|nr:Fic family protein [uncultured Oscillibacter sp.]
MAYEKILTWWREKRIRTAADIALEMNGNGAAFIYHSAKIENDRITYHDTREIFDHGGVSGYTGDVRSLFEIQNSVAAYHRMMDAFEKREALDQALLCEFQGLLTQGTYDTLRYQKGERPGSYKKNDYVTGPQEVGALPEDVPVELGELLAELENIRPEQALTAAAYFHAKFENIHPFADGNGRTGRLLMNYQLLLWDHPPIIIHEEDRRDYYAALERFDKAQDLDVLTAFLKEQTVKTWSARFERANRA